MSKDKIPHGLKINYDIEDEDGNHIHGGTFRMDIDQERRAFAERSLDALLKGYFVTTWKQ